MKLQKIRTGYVAVLLDEASRTKLLEALPPQFPDVAAHHVTVAYGIPKPDDELLGTKHMIKVIGHVQDDSLETLVVELDGKLQRDDGKIYHITWSMDKTKGRKAMQSNDLIKSNGFTPVEQPITIMGELQFFF